eukprot:GAHX01002887.1.p1 GENE.GAHX01002887.1~~GAHX01002887.1.p1  ORF type:complete len:345 (+),score=37.46 GAHX01002887.1:299-1333(+)
MYLRPSKICFSQDSIGCTFGRCTSHPYRPIGETLDDILTGRINVNSIPSISVYNKNGKWFTADNRRLWVFQEAEKRGKCSEIYVRETFYIVYNKFTTMNNGASVYVRGNPGGYQWQRMPIKEIQPNETPKITSLQTIPTSSYTNQNYIEDMDATDLCSKKLEQNVPTCNEMSTAERKESLSFEKNISKNDNVMSVDNGNHHSIDVDSDSEENNVDETSRNFFFGSMASYQQDGILGQHNNTAKPNAMKRAMEEHVEDDREIRDNEQTVINSSNIPGSLISSTFLNSNSETLELLENRDVAVTMCDEDNAKSSKCSKSKKCILFVFCLILVFVALLCTILSITLT